MNESGKVFIIPSTIAPNSTGTIPEDTKLQIKGTNYFLVENERSARRYISSLKLGITIEDLELHVLDKHTSYETAFDLLQAVKEGKNAGIISEAGCPGIADPGGLLVRAAHDLGIKVIPLVGPSSILMALMASGFNGQNFAFHGYLPIDKIDRKKAIKTLESKSVKNGQSQIFMETPYRNMALFDALIESCQPATRLCIASNLTSESEFIQTQSIGSWKKSKPQLHKIPTIFILGT